MLSLPLLKRTIRVNRKLWLFFLTLLVLNIVFVLGIYDLKMGNRMSALGKVLPETLMTILGIGVASDTLTSFLASSLFGFSFLVIPIFYEIIIANRLIAKQVETKNMTYLLASPNSRKCIAFTQAYFMILSLCTFFLFTTISGILLSWILFREKLVVSQFILLNIGAFCLHICLGGISFLASCICDDTRTSLMIGAGLPMLFFLIKLITSIGGELELLKYITVFTLFNPDAIMEGRSLSCIGLVVLAIVGMLFYQGGIKLFEKRDLPL